MKIKEGLRFKVPESKKDIIYTIDKIDGDIVHIVWEESESVAGISWHIVTDVDRFFDNGTWVPVEDNIIPDMKSLPEEYVVECKNGEETKKVMEFFDRKNYSSWNHWKYVTKTIKYDVQIFVTLLAQHNNLPILSFQEWERLVNNKTMEKKIIAYKVIKAFLTKAGWKVGDLVKPVGAKETFEEAPKWTEFFEPVYAPEEVTLKLGDKQIEVKIGKGYIRTSDRAFDIKYIEEINQKYFTNYSGTVLPAYPGSGLPVIVTSVKIGCREEGVTFTAEDLKTIITTYNTLQED